MPGVWHIKISDAKGLSGSNSIDTYCRVNIDVDNSRKSKSPMVKNTTNPTYNHTCSLAGKYSDQNIVLKIRKHKVIGSDPTIGQRSMAIVELKDGFVHRGRINLKDDYGGGEGRYGDVGYEIVWDAKSSMLDESKSTFVANRRTLLSGPTAEDVARSEAEEKARQEAIEVARAAEARRLAEEAAARQAAEAAALAEQRRLQHEAELEAKRQHDEATAARIAAEMKAREEEMARMEAERQEEQERAERLAREAAAAEAASAAAAAAAAEYERTRPLRAGESRDLAADAKEARVGLSWDAGKWDDATQSWEAVDLDASAFVLDSKGNYVDLCYFGQLDCLGGSLTHSGDNKDGQGDGDDETITLNLDSIPAEGHMIYFVCSSFSGNDFSDCDGETARLYVDGKLQVEIDMDSSAGTNNAFLCCRLARNDAGGWTLKACAQPATISSIRALLPVAQEASRDLISDIVVSEAPACVTVTKNETLRLGPLSNIHIGLGWEFKSEAIDLDANVATFKKDGTFLEKIYYGNTSGAGGSITHTGDNRSGEGEGDDESIICNLEALAKAHPGVHHLGISITSYKQHTFDNLSDAYCRIHDGNGRTLCRYDITHPQAVTAYLFAILSKDGRGGWNFNAVGIHGMGKSVSKTLKPLREIIQHGVTNAHGREALPLVRTFMGA